MSEILDITTVPINDRYSAAIATIKPSAYIFKEQEDTTPLSLGKYQYYPWGDSNDLPFELMSKVGCDETMSTCQQFNTEICYGGGLMLDTSEAQNKVKEEVDDFIIDNSLPAYWNGVCSDFKYFGFQISVITTNITRSKIVSIDRKEACYCRFGYLNNSPENKRSHVLYGNWRLSSLTDKDVEAIPLLDVNHPFSDLKNRLEDKNDKTVKFAILSKIPTVDSTMYPEPVYASLFKGKWYDIKTLIGVSKEAKLRNSAPIKYLVEINSRFWDDLYTAERITDPKKQNERRIEKQKEIISFITGAENSGKAWFAPMAQSPTGETLSYIRITKYDNEKEGGDWASDIIEAINMICFAMRVHSNLIGSVPGKAQTNNSGSDKRELYTIAQALQKPYHDILFLVFKIICKVNGWSGVSIDCPFIQLTTLDKKTDAKTVTTNN